MTRADAAALLEIMRAQDVPAMDSKAVVECYLSVMGRSSEQQPVGASPVQSPAEEAAGVSPELHLTVAEMGVC